MSGHIKYTQEEGELVRQLWLDGLPLREIAAQLPDRSYKSVDSYITRNRDNWGEKKEKAVNVNKRDYLNEIEQLEKRNAQLEKRLEKARQPRVKLTSKSKKPAKGTYTRVIIPDTHGCNCDADAVQTFLGDLEALDPQQIVMTGDHIDCGSFLAEHHTLGYVAEADYTVSDDFGAANDFLDAVQRICPEAEIHMIEGNHERRIERWCLTQARKNQKDAQWFLDKFSPYTELNIDQRGIHYYRQGRRYMGLRIPATIKLGQCYFTHGSSHGISAARKMFLKFGGNVVFGHTHRIATFQGWTVSQEDHAAFNVGCLCQLQPYWRHDDPSGWSHGYGLQLVRPDGDFLHVTVPIINGQSYLTSLLAA